MVILTKALVLLCSIHSTEETFKAEHKKRIKRTDFLLRITQIVSFVFLGIKYITSCNEPE